MNFVPIFECIKTVVYVCKEKMIIFEFFFVCVPVCECDDNKIIFSLTSLWREFPNGEKVSTAQ